MEIIFTDTTNKPLTLDEFKAYITETSSHRDNELSIMLDTVTKKVEEHCNISLADHDITVIQERKKAYQKLYYRPVSEVVSVVDDSNTALTFTADARNRKITLDYASEMTVTYKTTAQVEEKHKQAILDYATLLYSGSTDNIEYMNVLRNCQNTLL